MKLQNSGELEIKEHQVTDALSIFPFIVSPVPNCRHFLLGKACFQVQAICFYISLFPDICVTKGSVCGE